MFWMMPAVVAHYLEEERKFKEYIAILPPDERQGAIDRRRKQQEADRLERERRELLEAIKPHNLWSFLGLGRK